MTSHEFDAYCDTLPDSHFEPPYHEQIAIMQEFEDARENDLRRQGARAALEAVYARIAKMMWNNPSTSTGLWLAHREIKEQLAIL